jgi:hypothetical protein
MLLPKHDRILHTVKRIGAKPDDHRRWKKLLRLCAEVGRKHPKVPSDPALTTCVDSTARKSRRRYFHMHTGGF